MSRDVGWIVTEWDSVARTWSVEGATPWPAGQRQRAEDERDELQAAHGGTWAVAMVVLSEGSLVGPDAQEALR